MKELVFLLSLTSFCFGLGERGPCIVFPNGCCPNTVWNSESERCVNCEPGYYWINCSKSCPYPLFGLKCLHKCSCEEEVCNFSTGCPKDNCLTKKIHLNRKNEYTLIVVIASVVFVLVFTGYITVWIIERRNKSDAR